MPALDYVTRVLNAPGEIAAAQWNALLALQAEPSPFMRHEYLAAMHESGSAMPETGWTPRFVTLWRGDVLQAACALYLKAHSYGEYVFDWAWANAYQQHRVPYYPKGLIAAPFTPVPGTRLLARDEAARAALVQAVIALCGDEGLSSLHMLFAGDADVAAASQAGMMLRHTVQFHWKNAAPSSRQFTSFDDFLTSLNQEKRKKIRQERRKVAEAGVTFRWARGADIAAGDWDFFYRCYERTYLEHGNAPYLSRDFFRRMAATMPENWLLFVAERPSARGPVAIATSLVALGSEPAAGGADSGTTQVAYGRYWGALERVDCLHFEACYYQPLAWCIEHGFHRFEGGAQGEHKMARALLPVKTTSAHWLAHPAFADAVERFLEREGQGISEYMEALEQRNPFRAAG
ncbi:GNAT family N-acetyltransferase [Rhodoferax koreense]|uniref:GNAT family N-acetyltransferase n=1 Tax=Rhodoferax koreensis TaxID=1842727 RepID=A0A1P8JWT4_9BURK|nr:GNAT family N-acetyltransferase [Rhodoferax koreense]APW38217.1 GNAT family N-acetyltransferase [Rhodoferax koreense]